MADPLPIPLVAVRLTARALLLGERIDTAGLERSDLISTTPLAFRVGGSGYAVLLTDASGAVLYEKADPGVPNLPLERMGPGVAVRGAGREVIAVLDAACVASGSRQ